MKKKKLPILFLMAFIIISNLTSCNNKFASECGIEKQLQFLIQDYKNRFKETIKLEKDDQNKSFNLNMYFFPDNDQLFVIIEGNPFFPFFFVNYNDSLKEDQVDQKYSFSTTIADEYCSFYFENDSIMSLLDFSGNISTSYDSLQIKDYITNHSMNHYHPLFYIYKQNQDESWEYYGKGVNEKKLNYPSYFNDNWVISDEIKQLWEDLNI